MAFWPTLIRLVDTFEGAVGAVLNCAVIYMLWSRKYSANLTAFRISITITALYGLLYAVITVMVLNVAHIFQFEHITVIVYGYIATLNESVCHFLVCFSVVLTFGIWEMVPGPCLLQYLRLCRPHLSAQKRFALAYGPCCALMLWSCPCSLIFHPARAFTALVQQFHHPDPQDPVIVVGAVLMPTPEHPTSMLIAAIAYIIPTFTAACGIFAFCIKKSQEALKSHHIKLSEKTISMHRKFLTMMTLQNLLPLAVIFIPIGGLSVIVLTGGASLGLMTILLSFTLWTLPIVQGSVVLLFVVRINRNRTMPVHPTLRSKSSKTRN